jgi:hypothetical protein
MRAWRTTRRLGLKRGLRLMLLLAGIAVTQRRLGVSAAEPLPVAFGPGAPAQDPDPEMPPPMMPPETMASPVAGADFRATFAVRGTQVGTVTGRFTGDGDVSVQASGPRDARARLALVGQQLYFTFAEEWRVADAAMVCQLNNVALSAAPPSGPPSSGLTRSEWTRLSLADPLAAFGATDSFQEVGQGTVEGVSVIRYSGATEVGRLLRAIGAVLGIDDACAAIILELGMEYANLKTAAPGLIPVELSLGAADRFLYALRYTLRDTDGIDLDGDVVLTPSGTPPSVEAPPAARPATLR